MPEPSWLEENRGRLLGLLIVGTLGTIGFLYFTDRIAEDVIGLLMAAAFVVGACGFALHHLLENATGRVRAVAYGLGLAAFAVSMTLVYTTLEPGAPAVHGELRAPGDTLPLADHHGHMRMLLRGHPAGSGAEEVKATLAVGDELVQGEISRTVSRGRRTRRGGGGGSVVTEHDSEYVLVNVPTDAQSVRLVKLEGHLDGALDVSLFRERVPYFAELIAAGLILLGGALLAARIRASTVGVAALGAAIAFALGVYRYATPTLAVRPEIGAMLGGSIVGGAAAALLTLLVRKLAAPPEPARR